MTKEGAWSAFVEDYDIAVPGERVEEELRVMLTALSHQMQYAVFTTGRDARLPTAEEQEAQREELRDEAYLAVKEELVLAELLARQDFPVSREELEAEAEAVARRQDVTAEMVRGFFGEDLAPLAREIRQRKAMDWVWEQAQSGT